MRYYVTNSSRLVDAVLNPALSPQDLESKIISQTGSQYKVYSTDSGTSGYRKFTDMFSVDLQGQIPLSVSNGAENVFKTSWELYLNSKILFSKFFSLYSYKFHFATVKAAVLVIENLDN